jgi:hypothetical protein
MVYQKTNWNPYDETKSEQENIENNAVVTAEKMNHLEDGLVAHENDKSNIHAVTAAQTGAYTKKETDDKFVPKTQTATATQAGILKVIHGLTSADQLSALSAAAGKSLDDKIRNIPIQKISPKPATDLPSTYSVGISITDGTTNLGYPNNWCIVQTVKFDATRATQYCYPMKYLTDNDKLYMRAFGSSSDSWGEWQPIIMGKDVIDNLTSILTNMPLSANQGKTLNDKINIINAKIADTGWVNGTWGTDITSYNSDSSDLIRFRKIGNEVYFKGVAKNTKVLPTGVQVLVKNIPAAFIPSDGLNVYFPVMQGSNKYTWHCALKATDKTLTLERYGSTSIIDVPANQWLPFSGSYPV